MKGRKIAGVLLSAVLVAGVGALAVRGESPDTVWAYENAVDSAARGSEEIPGILRTVRVTNVTELFTRRQEMRSWLHRGLMLVSLEAITAEMALLFSIRMRKELWSIRSYCAVRIRKIRYC